MTWDLPNHLDVVDHVAFQVKNIDAAVHCFRCAVGYRNATWPLLQFANMRLAFVVADQHPPHIAFRSGYSETLGPLKPQRDGTRLTNIEDPPGHTIEILAAMPEGGE